MIWTRKELEKKFEANTTIISDHRDDAQAATILNRLVRSTVDGCELESDRRHAELVIQQFGLSGKLGVSTPGCDTLDNIPKDPGDEVDLDGEVVTAYRAIVVCLNCLALGRPDLAFSVQ